MTFAISGPRRPKRSASMPKISAPIGRKASVAVSVKMMSFFGTLNAAERWSSRKTTTKKSKASRVQPRNPARTAWREEEACMCGEDTIHATHEQRSPRRESRLLQAPGGAHVPADHPEERHARALQRRQGGDRFHRHGR